MEAVFVERIDALSTLKRTAFYHHAVARAASLATAAAASCFYVGTAKAIDDAASGSLQRRP
ncbi:hypothetical protein O9929_08525 [Vibrio lentus]|nr:hypothetical protein [Vibrio lentus]